MAKLAEDALDFAARVDGLASRPVLLKAFAALVAPLGGAQFTASFVSGAGEEARVHSTVGRLPEGWTRLYEAQAFDESDIVFKSALTQGVRGYWDEHLNGLVLPRSAHLVMQAARDRGMQDGYTTRVLLDGGGVAVAMVCGAELDRSPAARAVLHWGCHLFANRAAGLVSWRRRPALEGEAGEGGATFRLTARQQQILRLRAGGRRNSEVAGILKLSTKTVESHNRQILQRLGVRTMLQAVEVAHKLGLLA